MMLSAPRSSRRDRTARIAILATCAVALVSSPSFAQSVSSSLGVGIATGNALVGPLQGALLLQPSLRWDHPHAMLDAQGSWIATSGSSASGDASVNGMYFSPVFHGLRLELGGTAQHNGGPDVIETSNGLQGDARLSLAFGAGGVWIGASQLASASETLPSHVQSFGAGSWRRVGDLVLTASFTASGYGTPNPFDSLGNSAPDDTLSRHDNGSTLPRQYADLESSVYWSHGPLSVDALLGTRVSSSYGQRSTWGRAQASWAIGQQFALVAAGGTRAPEPAVGRIGGSFMSLGVRLASTSWIGHALHGGARSSASAFGVRAEGATRVLYVRAPAARTVELMADFTDWQPVSMRRAVNDEWELAMPIAPGAHRLNIRVDGGEWTAPPGASTARDEFNGVVGLVVVP
jgi:hypothetical protein